MGFEQLEAFVLTDTGRRRERNEDAVLAIPEAGLFCVADGMGGAAGGQMASRTVMERIRQAFDSVSPAEEQSLDANIRTLRLAVDQADAEIKAWADERGIKGTGTTLVALVFDPACSVFGCVLHAGDSRAYRIRGGKLSRLSQDHSVAGALGLNDEQAMPSRFSGVITHAIGIQDGLGLEETTIDVEEGDVYLACSDGLTRMLPDSEIAAVIAKHAGEDVETLARRLVSMSKDAGGVDNISVALVRVRNTAVDVWQSSAPATSDAAAAPKPTGPDEAQEEEAVSVPPVPAPSSPRTALLVLVLIVLVCCTVLVYRGGLTLRLAARSGTRSVAREVEDVSAAGVALPAVESEVQKAIRGKVEQALASGRWGQLRRYLVREVPDADELLESVELEEVYGGWLHQWEKFCQAESIDAAQDEFQAGARLVQDLCRQLGAAVSAAEKDSLPESCDQRADLFCRRSYGLQKQFLELVKQRTAELAGRLPEFKEDRSGGLHALCRMGGADAGEAKRIAAGMIGVASRIPALERWIVAHGDRPLNSSAAREIVELTIPTMDRDAGRVWEMLRAAMLALSAESIRAYCGENAISDDEVQNILILRDRLLSPVEPSDSAADWPGTTDVKRVKLFVKRLARQRPADRTESPQ